MSPDNHCFYKTIILRHFVLDNVTEKKHAIFLKSVFLSKCFVSMFSGDNLSYHNGSMFSTWDQENASYHCSQRFHGAWWYKNCYMSNLNGKYIDPGVYNDISMNWGWVSYGESLKSTRIKIRPISF